MEYRVRNVWGGTLTVDDMGLPIANLETIDLIDYGYTLDDIFSSHDLDSLITAGHLVMNDGTRDLSVSEALEHTNVQSEFVDSSDENGGGSGGVTREFAIAMSLTLGG